ncbi:MAG: MBL fold metallo-hydrolase [Jatrophihabitans sp.]|nr:MAG: MBL fold metallo-hydrolase [Jatrophihabitans sp.]
MILERYYLQCLSHASYLVGDEASGQAVVVDPRRDVEEYLSDAAARGVRIVGVINTHLHADFVAGHLELAAATGAWIGYGRRADAAFEFRPLAHGERIALGEVELQVLETPGHTWESISVVVRERPGAAPHAVLTGDAMFIGDVGRPDLAAAAGSSAQDLARALYHSVHDVLLRLPDPTLVMPAHGAGSACGKNLSTELVSTIGAQRHTNPSVRPMSEEQFVAELTVGQPLAPAYFSDDVQLNRSLHSLLATGAPLPGLRAEDLPGSGTVVIDSRVPDEFAGGHLRGSINVGLDGRFAETAGMVAGLDERIVVVAEPGREQETRTRLGRIGFDNVVGYVAWPLPRAGLAGGRTDTAERVDVGELEQARRRGAIVLDVRNPDEVEQGAVPGSVRIPLPHLRRRMEELPNGERIVVYCASGWRSSVAASLMRWAGFADVCDVRGGYDEWSRRYHPAPA